MTRQRNGPRRVDHASISGDISARLFDATHAQQPRRGEISLLFTYTPLSSPCLMMRDIDAILLFDFRRAPPARRQGMSAARRFDTRRAFAVEYS